MADVGVLNLTIKDNSEEAIAGLDLLKDALRAIKDATNSTGLAKVAGALKKINEAVNVHTITNLNGLAVAMKKVQDACNFTVPNLSGLTRVRNAMREVGDSARGIREAQQTTQEMTDEFSEAKAHASEVRIAVDDLSESIKEANSANGVKLDFSVFDPSKLPFGALGKEISNVTRESIQIGDAVKDSFETIKNAGMLDTVGDVRKLGETTTAIVPYVEKAEMSWDNLSKELEEVKTQVNAVMKAFGEGSGIVDGFFAKFNANKSGFVFDAESTGVKHLTEAQYKILEELNSAFENSSFRDKQNLRDSIDNETSTLMVTVDEAGNVMTQVVMKVTGVIEEKLQEVNAAAEDTKGKFQEIGTAVEGTKETLNGNMNFDSSIKSGLKDLEKEIESIGSSSVTSSEKLASLREKAEILKDEIDSGFSIRGKMLDDKQLANYKIQLDGLIEKIYNLQKKADACNLEINLNNYSDTKSKLELLIEKYNALRDKFNEDLALGRLDSNGIINAKIQIENVKEQIEKLIEKEEEAKRSSFSFSDAFASLKGGIKELFPGLQRLEKQFANIARRMALRAIIKQITSGFREGVENVYKYSKAVGTSFAPSMDSAASSLLLMKNSIGAAVAPALQALIPVLQTVVGWFINLVNVVNQFFALLNGQSQWTRALTASTEAYADSAKKAGGAANDWLADFDELNVMSSGGGGGGGGAGALDFANMFEEVGEFDGKIKDLVNWIQEHMETIKGIAIAIGAAILGWKFSHAFEGMLGSLGQLILGGAMIAIGLQISYSAAYQAGLKGEFDAETLLATIGGAISAAIGGALIGFKVAGPWGAVIGGAAGLIVDLLVVFKAHVDGTKQRLRAAAWGKVHLTDDQIKDLVDTEVTAKVNAWLEIANLSIKNRQGAKLRANVAIQQFGTDLATAKFELEANQSPEGVNKAVESAKAAIAAINESLEASKEGLKISFTKFKYVDSEGTDITQDLYGKLEEGTTALQGFFNSLGSDIAKYISEGFQKGIGSEEWIMGMKLMDTFANITKTAENNYAKGKILRRAEETTATLGDKWDEETAQSVLESQNAILWEYKNTVTKQWQEDLDDYYKNIEYYKEAVKYFEGKGDTENAEAFRGYIESTKQAIANTEGWLEEVGNGTYDWMNNDETYKEIVETMRSGWIDRLKEWFRPENTEAMLGNRKSIFDYYLNGEPVNPTASKIGGMFNIQPWDMFDSDEMKQFFETAYKDAQEEYKKGYNQRNYSTFEEFFSHILDERGIPYRKEYEYPFDENVNNDESLNDYYERINNEALDNLDSYKEEIEKNFSAIREEEQKAEQQKSHISFGEINSDIAEYVLSVVGQGFSLDEAKEYAGGVYDLSEVQKVFDFIAEYSLELLKEDLDALYNGGSQGRLPNAGMIVAAGSPQETGLGYGGFNTNAGDTEDTAAAVASGTRQGTVDINLALGAIQGLLRSLISATSNNRVVVAPSSAMARGVTASFAQFSNVTGNP